MKSVGVTTAPLDLGLDERSPYEAAAAVIRTIAELAPDLTNEELVWQAFARWRGSNQLDYIQAVRRTQHSIFYYQQQHLYEFGIEQVPAQHREDFCYNCGRHFLKTVLAETIYPLLQVALAKPGAFQSTIVEMIRTYLNRFGGNRYLLSEEIKKDEILLTIQDRLIQSARQNLQQYGLIPERCFQNSVLLITGGVHEFVGQVVERFDPPAEPCQIGCFAAVIRLPIVESDRFAFDRLLQTLMQFIQQVHSRQNAAGEERQLENDLVLDSPVMRETWNRIRRASQSEEIVLLLGESGTGKTFIAQKIHALSGRREGPFIQVCVTSDVGSENLIQSNLFGHEKGAFTGATDQKQGLFSLAQGGTIFLDEIGDASPELQAKLLRVVETSTFKRLGGAKDIHVDVRVITATHRNLEQLVEGGRFREDLFYRLNVISIKVPSLRERPESIPALTQFFVGRLSRSKHKLRPKIAPDLLNYLQLYPWPGNLRELEHAIKHAFAMSDELELTLAAFPEKIRRFVHGKSLTTEIKEPCRSEVINTDALRNIIRTSDAVSVGNSEAKHELPCHVDFAKRSYLRLLIDELNGDLSLIGNYWDHHSEKTLRALIHAYGLVPHLQLARNRSRLKKSKSQSREHDSF